MINLGLYLETLSDEQCLPLFVAEMERAKKENKIKDVSIFYDDIGPLPNKINAGCFNSTDMWNFSGDLLVFSMQALEKSTKYINNFNIYYCYGLKPYSTIPMIRILDMHKIPTIALNDECANNFFRITNTKPIAINNYLQNAVTTIMEYKNE